MTGIGTEIKGTENIPVEMMIENPAAARRMDQILDVKDFTSIGTNDLIQYINVADREKIAVSHYYQVGIELALRVIEDILSAANKEGKKCILCGEIAGNTEYTKELIAMGLKNFSALPPLIPTVKDKVFEINCGNHITEKGR